MPTREAFSNFIITLIVLFFMAIIGMLLKARYRLPSERSQVETIGGGAVPKAIPVAQPVEVYIPEARAYKSGEYWVLPHPELVVSRGNEADTLRIKSGDKEDVFVLYFVDALDATWTHPKRINEQSAYFGKSPTQRVLEFGSQALGYVTQILRERHFQVYTKWGRVPESERYYAMISVELEPGKRYDLAELLVRKGFASPTGQAANSMPASMKPVEEYSHSLLKALSQAKADRAGIWAYAQ